jgi:hypothetical protein
VLEHAQKTGDIGRLAHHYSPCGKIIKRDFIENTPSDSEPGRLAKMPFFLPQPQQVVEHGFINPKSTGFHPVHYDDGWNVWIPPTKDNDKDNGSNTKP